MEVSKDYKISFSPLSVFAAQKITFYGNIYCILKDLIFKWECLWGILRKQTIFFLAGLNRDGYDKDGYDLDGYNRYGYNKEGYNRWGFNRTGYDRGGNTDNQGIYDQNGFDDQCLDIQGKIKIRISGS
jgi:hypothetical protein